VLRRIFECKDIHVHALPFGDLLERQQVPWLEENGCRGTGCHDPLEPHVVVWRESEWRTGSGTVPPLLWRQAILLDRACHEVVKGSGLGPAF